MLSGLKLLLREEPGGLAMAGILDKLHYYVLRARHGRLKRRNLLEVVEACLQLESGMPLRFIHEGHRLRVGKTSPLMKILREIDWY